MPIRIDDNYREIIDRFTKSPETIVFFVGAGMSQPLFPPWKEVLVGLLKMCIDRDCLAYRADEIQVLIENGDDYLEIADALVDSLDPIAFRAFMERIFDKDIDDNRVSTAYRKLFDLKPRLLLTTNYDRIPNILAPRNYRMFTHKQSAEALRAIESGRDTVLKLHGDIQDQDSIILTRKDYNKIIHLNTSMQSVLRTVFSSKTVIFIGFSLTDPNLSLALSSLKAIHQDLSVSHYALMSDMSSFRANVFEKNFGIRVIRYKPSNSAHPEVEQFLTALQNNDNQTLSSNNQLLSESEILVRAKKYRQFDPDGIINVTSSNDERIQDYKQCLLEATDDCFISGTSMIHLTEDSKDLIRRKAELGVAFRLLIMDPAWISQNNHLLTFLPSDRAREQFHIEIQNSIEKALSIRGSLPVKFRNRLQVRTYSTFFPYIITGFSTMGDGKLVTEVTDYLPGDRRPRFTVQRTGMADCLFEQVKEKFDSLWNNTQLTKKAEVR